MSTEDAVKLFSGNLMKPPLLTRILGAARLRSLATWVVWATLGLGSSGPAVAADAAPIRMVSTLMHGVRVDDPYRYMENVRDPQVRDWLVSQGEAARGVLDQIDVRERLLKRLEAVSLATGDQIGSLVRMPGDRLFYLKRERGERQFKLRMRTGIQGQEQLLVDPEAISARTGVPHAINYFVPSWDGQHIAYGLSAGGSEDASLYILQVATGQLVGAPIPRVQQGLVHWLPDSRSLTFNQLKMPVAGEPATEVYLDSQVLWLTVGQAQSAAIPVFGPTVTRGLGLSRLDVGEVFFSPDSRWMLARTTDTTLPEGFLFVAPAADLGKPDLVWRKIAGPPDQIHQAALRGDDLYLRTPQGAPRNRVLRLDLNMPTLASATVVAVAPPDEVLERFSLNQDALIAEMRQGTQIRLRRFTGTDTAGTLLPTEFAGASRLHGDPSHAYKDVLFTLSGWTEGPRMFRWDGQQLTDTGLRPRIVAAGLPEITVTELLAPSHDGTLVPMTVLHRKGLVLDGKNPTLLRGYGAYGFSETAYYSPETLVWIEQGGVMVHANVRGSGVYGRDWYQAGFKTTKSNTWKDGIACARALIAQGYASPQTLAISGGSAGGIFAGRAITAAPELFAAAIIQVGMLDAIRSEESANGITNISEFGTVKHPLEFAALLEMSTYHQIQDGVAYPAVMLVHGMNDPRVDVWNSAKVAARLQAANKSTKPTLLRLDLQAGHGMGSTTTQRRSESADAFAFLLWQMGRASGPR